MFLLSRAGGYPDSQDYRPSSSLKGWGLVLSQGLNGETAPNPPMPLHFMPPGTPFGILAHAQPGCHKPCPQGRLIIRSPPRQNIPKRSAKKPTFRQFHQASVTHPILTKQKGLWISTGPLVYSCQLVECCLRVRYGTARYRRQKPKWCAPTQVCAPGHQTTIHHWGP